MGWKEGKEMMMDMTIEDPWVESGGGNKTFFQKNNLFSNGNDSFPDHEIQVILLKF